MAASRGPAPAPILTALARIMALVTTGHQSPSLYCACKYVACTQCCLIIMPHCLSVTGLDAIIPQCPGCPGRGDDPGVDSGD